MAKIASRKTAKPGGLTLKRRYVVKDEKLLSPVFADFSTIVLSADMVIQNFYQTVLPVENVSEGAEVDTALVARFVYSPDFFKALMSLLVRQYPAFEDIRGKRNEAIKWLKQLVQEVESGNSRESAEPNTVQ